jgi:hypothetical protein
MPMIESNEIPFNSTAQEKDGNKSTKQVCTCPSDKRNPTRKLVIDGMEFEMPAMYCQTCGSIIE